MALGVLQPIFSRWQRLMRFLANPLERVVGTASGFRSLSIVIAIILLFAAAMKTYALWVADKPSQTLVGIPGWLVVPSIIIEWVLGIWLLTGVRLFEAWLSSVVCFAVFLCFALKAAISGASVCGCFGFLAISPWLTCSLDVAVLMALIAFRSSFTDFDSSSASSARTAHIRVGTFGLTVLAAAILFGRGLAAQFVRLHSVTVQSTVDVVNPFMGAVASGNCEAHCLEETVSTARALLGLDPISPYTTSGEDLTSLFKKLRVDAHEVGSSIEIVHVERILAELSPGLVQPVVLVSKDNHLFLLLGGLDINGEMFCEVIHGNSPVSLVSFNEVRRARLKEAWKLNCHSEGVPFSIGPSEKIRVDSILHNYGEVNPGIEATCKFMLTNLGGLPIVLDRARTSCGCTATDLLQSRSLPPGGTTTVAVSMRPSGAASARETVIIPASVEDGKYSREIELQLLGCHRDSKEIVPKMLDFGTVEPGKNYVRMVRMTEVPSDRFKIRDVVSNGIPLVRSVERIFDKDGLATYRIRLTLAVEAGLAGERSGAIVVTTTTGKENLTISIPVRFYVKP